MTVHDLKRIIRNLPDTQKVIIATPEGRAIELTGAYLPGQLVGKSVYEPEDINPNKGVSVIAFEIAQ